MTTVIDLTEQELAELQKATRQADAVAAVRIAMTEYLRYVRRMQLKELSGKVEMQDSWRGVDKAEGTPAHEDQGPGSD